jgi:hypothetical protein
VSPRRSSRSLLDRLSDELQGELSRFGVHAGLADLVERWPGVVGEAIARNAWPARIARDGTVHVNTADSVWAFELGQRTTEIARRLEVPRIRFAPGPLPSAPATPQVPATPEPTAEEQRLAAQIAAQIADENLRQSVQKAVSLALARRAGDRPV